jgi:two-component system response regulator FlrC
LSADAAHQLLVHTWPGNVRELDNVLQRALILCQGPVVEADHIEIEIIPASRLPATTSASDTMRARGGALAKTLERAEQEILLEALRAPQVTRRAIAEHLGISPRTLRYKLARLRAAGVDVPAA